MPADPILYVGVALLSVVVVLLLALLARRPSTVATGDLTPLRDQLQADSRSGRMELSTQLKDQRDELRRIASGSTSTLDQLGAGLKTSVDSLVNAQAQALSEITRTLTPAYLSYQAGFANQQWGQAAAIAFILFVIIVIFTLVQRWVLQERKVSKRRMRLYNIPLAEPAAVTAGTPAVDKSREKKAER